MNRERLLECAVKDWFARRVDEVCEQHRVFIGKWFRAVVVEIETGRSAYDQKKGHECGRSLMTFDAGGDVFGSRDVRDSFGWQNALGCCLRNRDVAAPGCRQTTRHGSFQLCFELQPLLESTQI